MRMPTTYLIHDFLHFFAFSHAVEQCCLHAHPPPSLSVCVEERLQEETGEERREDTLPLFIHIHQIGQSSIHIQRANQTGLMLGEDDGLKENMVKQRY